MGFPRHEYWSRLSFPTPGDRPDSGTEPVSLASPALAGRFFTTVPPGQSYWIRVGPKSNDWHPHKKRRKHMETEGRRPYEDKGGNGKSAATDDATP